MVSTGSMRTALVLASLALMVSVTSTVAWAQTPAVDPAAVEMLQRMTDYTSNLQQFSAHTENTFEDVLDSGQRIDISVASDVVVRRPDRIYAERSGEQTSQVFYYDGTTLTLYNPSDGVYATQPAPGTIEELLDFVRESLGLDIPVSDLVYRNALAILIQDVTSAQVIGKTMIGGMSCTHLVFGRPDVDFQVWVADGDQPLPCKYVVTDTSTPELLSAVSVMSNWNVAPAVSDTLFEFKPPEGVQSITFMPLDESSGVGQ